MKEVISTQDRHHESDGTWFIILLKNECLEVLKTQMHASVPALCQLLHRKNGIGYVQSAN